MAGGMWEVQNKVRPGVYINFKSTGLQGVVFGERGTVALPMTLDWGPEQEVQKIESADLSGLFYLLGHTIVDPELLLLKEAFKGAKTVLFYRLNKGTKATATIGECTITAKYSGTLGNKIKVVIQSSVVDEEKYDVQVFVGQTEVDFQTVSDVKELQNNSFVEFSGEGTLTLTAGLPLTGGDDGTVSTVEYADFLAKIEAYEFNTICYAGPDIAIKQLFSFFTRRLRDEEGIKIQCVLAENSEDYEGILSVKNGVILEDGTELPAEKAVAYVAGASAGCRIYESLTYSKYPGVVNVDNRLTHSEIIEALQAGHIVFVPKNDAVIIEQDINTLTTFTPEKNQIFRKNRPIRTLDQINNDVRRLLEERYIGKVNNNDDGRNLVKNDILRYLQELERLSALQNVQQEDVIVTKGMENDAVVVDIYAQPVDSMEKFYIQVVVS